MHHKFPVFISITNPNEGCEWSFQIVIGGLKPIRKLITSKDSNFKQKLTQIISKHWKSRRRKKLHTQIQNNLMGFFPLNTASGRTKRRSFPFGTFHDVTQPPNRYTSASLQPIEFNSPLESQSQLFHLHTSNPQSYQCTMHLPFEPVKTTLGNFPSPSVTLTPEVAISLYELAIATTDDDRFGACRQHLIQCGLWILEMWLMN